MAFVPELPPLFSAILALAFVIALVWLAGRLAPRLLSPGWIAARAVHAGAGARLTRMDTLAIGPRHHLHLVRCEGRDVLLLTGGPQDLVVGWLPEKAL